MKIKCKKDHLYKGFQLLSGIIANTTTKPILKNIKIEVNDNSIELFATDLEIGIRYFIPVEDTNIIIENGIIVLPESKIENILKEWIDEYIEINTEGNRCFITGKDSYFALNGEFDESQFPVKPEFSEGETFEIDPYVLNQMIKRTAFVVVGERIRYALSGILFNVNGNHLEMVSTDGRRLSKVSKVIENPLNILCDCIVPVKGLLQLERIISNELKNINEKKIKIKIENNRILFKSQNFILAIQLIDSKYPDCNKIIPTESSFNINLDLQKFYSAVKRAAIVTSEDSKLVKFEFNNNKLILSAEIPEVGISRVEIDIDYKKENYEIGFNPDFIKEALNVMSNDIISFELSLNGKSGVLKEILSNYKSNEDGKFIHVVMPIKLKKEDGDDEEEDDNHYENDKE